VFSVRYELNFLNCLDELHRLQGTKHNYFTVIINLIAFYYNFIRKVVSVPN
jgi:hypothetical protein